MKYVVVDDIQPMGASKSLYATMKDIDRMIEGLPLDKARPLRKKLRYKIRRAIYQFEEQWKWGQSMNAGIFFRRWFKGCTSSTPLEIPAGHYF